MTPEHKKAIRFLIKECLKNNVEIDVELEGIGIIKVSPLDRPKNEPKVKKAKEVQNLDGPHPFQEDMKKIKETEELIKLKRTFGL